MRVLLFLAFLLASSGAWASCPSTPADCPPLTTNDPTIVGTVSGGATYDDGAFSGTWTGTENLPGTGGFEDISRAPYNAPCDVTATIDISLIVTAALATGRDVLIPPCPGNPAWPWVFGDIDITSRNGITGSGGALVRPKPGSDYLVRITTSDGYYRGLDISDTTDIGQTSNVVRTAVVAGGTGDWNASTITISGANGTFKVGQRLSILLDDGGWYNGRITAVSGNDITFTSRLPYTAANGNAVWASYGLIWVGCGATGFEVSGFHIRSGWTGVYVQCPPGVGNSPAQVGTIRDIVMDKGWMAQIWCGNHCAGNAFININSAAGWVNQFTRSGDGVTTNFPLNGFRVWSNLSFVQPLITVGGVQKFYPADWAFSTDGLSINFTSPPAAGTNNISIRYRVFAAEGLVDDPEEGPRDSGNRYMTSNFGVSEASCKWTGGLALTTNKVVSGLLCGPSFNSPLRFDRTGSTYVSNVTGLNGGPVSVSVVNGAVVNGDIVAVPVLSTSVVSGLDGMALVNDYLTGKLTGRFDNQSSEGSVQFDRGKLIFANNVTVPAYTSGTCEVNGDHPPGVTSIDCTLTSGSVAIGQLASPTAVFTGSVAADVLTVSSVTSGTLAVDQAIYCNICEPGTLIIADTGGGGGAGTYQLNISQTVSSRVMSQGYMPSFNTVVGYSADIISVPERTGAEIPNGTVLTWAGPQQPTGAFGPRKIPYQRTTPLAGATVTFGDGIQFALVQPAGTLATLTFQLPGCNPNIEGMVRGFSSTQIITALTVTDADGGTVLGAPASLTAGGTGGVMSFICRGATNTWFPAG